MENKRPANWWNSTPKIINGKVLCVAILPDGEETTNLFTLEELSRLLTQRPPDLGQAVENPSNDDVAPSG
jgi:hypothetical protein